MDKAIVGFVGVLVGGLFQAVLFWLKYRADAIEKIRERQVVFAADVAQYLRLVSDIKYAEEINTAMKKTVAVEEPKRNDVSARYRSVVSSAYGLMACGDGELADLALDFVEGFDKHADKLRKMSTGAQGKFPDPDDVEQATRTIRQHQPKLPMWPWGRYKGKA